MKIGLTIALTVNRAKPEPAIDHEHRDNSTVFERAESHPVGFTIPHSGEPIWEDDRARLNAEFNELVYGGPRVR